ncbi:Zinc finger and SCAN domain-containing protein 31 [Toxocara canis]|uniref:Zinc finger and SCAN domain-containing protein 31 n=1 Tax=Toxocara canis TaxID=6265 RepID=A0A0B2UNR7_TOXCA|nr:Zinc finger and SCAN domain-containing protein 31 [Toxocara canis]
MSGGTPELLIRTTPGGGGGQHTASTVEGGGGEKLRNTLPTSLIQVAASAAQLDNNCNLCAKSFPSQKLLQQHQHMFHTEKAFICEICGKAFRFRSNLAEHRSVHTALKPYVCKFCGKSSRLKGNLTKHILKHHKKEQDAYIGKDDIIIKKGKKSVKDPAAVDFLEKSMIVLTASPSENPLNLLQSKDELLDDENEKNRSFLMSLGLDTGSMDLRSNSPEEDSSIHALTPVNSIRNQYAPPAASSSRACLPLRPIEIQRALQRPLYEKHTNRAAAVSDLKVMKSPYSLHLVYVNAD